jgi:hypothetical protein
MSKQLLFSLIVLNSLSPLFAAERADEIRTEMWSTSNKNFQIVETPKKWANQSAIIIAQLNRFEYRKAVIVSTLKYNEYNHYRIKLLDKNAVDKYSEMSYYENYGSTKVYVGFKVIKANGKEVIVDLAKAVKMEKDVNGVNRSYNKLAIPGLEKGDVIDYYICEESSISSNSIIYFFEPVVYSLPREYPVMNHKLQFRAERRCFINLKSLNGAPELKLQMDEANEEQYYTLDVTDLDAVKDQRWAYPYRELPTIKFRAAYASGKAMRNLDVLLGEPGIVKSSVSKKELEELAATMMATVYDIKMFSKFAKTNLKGVTDPFEIAKQAYYFYRNDLFGTAEANLVEGNGEPSISEVKFVDVFSTFLASKKIQHDIVIATKRNVSTIDNILMENEIDWLVRVKKGDQYLYLSPIDMYSIPGEINPLLQGTEAYALDGMVPFKKWDAKKITLPVTTKKDNRTEVTINVQLENLTKAKASVSKSLTGRTRAYDQNAFMDLYDYEKEERDRFKMDESFTGYSFYKKKYLAMKTAYMGKRPTYKTDALKGYLEQVYDFKAKATAEVIIKQTGRYDNAAAMMDEFSFEAEDVVQKAGPNYLIDAGKLIESQVKIEGDELNRSTNVYFDYPRSFAYHITIDIPSGYTVQGLDKFNQQQENQFGGFTSKAKEQGGKIVIDTEKHYDAYFVPKAQWSSIVAFLNSANSFTEQKILLKKK